MLAFILSIIFALVIAFLVTMDASRATLYIGTTTFAGIPMFYIVFTSIIVGLLLGSITNIKNLIESKLTIFWQRSDLKKSNKKVDDQQLKIDKLEEDKLELKEQIKEKANDKKES